jgi:hypothetical protein
VRVVSQETFRLSLGWKLSADSGPLKASKAAGRTNRLGIGDLVVVIPGSARAASGAASVVVGGPLSKCAGWGTIV